MAWEEFGNHDDSVRRSKIVEFAKKYNPASILDIGCGEGFITDKLPGSFILGVDNSEIAIKRAVRFKENKNISYVVGDVTVNNLLPIAEPFDMIVMTGLLYKQYIKDKEDIVFENVNRLLKLDGILLVCNIASWTYWPITYKRLEWTTFDYGHYKQLLEVYRKP